MLFSACRGVTEVFFYILHENDIWIMSTEKKKEMTVVNIDVFSIYPIYPINGTNAFCNNGIPTFNQMF